MEEIMQAIKEAEERAAAIKAEAEVRAAEIIAEAEKRAAETEKNAREVCKAYRATQMKLAAEAAEAQYAETVAEIAAEARAKKEALAKGVDATVAHVVGRIVNGDC